MPEDSVREMWSEDDLDTALATLRSDVDLDARVLARSRADLLVAATGKAAEAARAPRHRPLAWWTAAAAGVVALVAGLLLVEVGERPVANAAAKELNLAADRISTSDEPLGPGQYRYVATRAWWMTVTSPSETESYTYLEERLIEHWVPADQRREWLVRETATGDREWIEGSEEEARAAGLEFRGPGPVEERRAPCGDFHTELEGIPPCTFEGGWDHPNARFMASLPRDPRELYDELSDEADSSWEVLEYADGVLRGGLVPADLRAALYRALAFVPGLRVTEEVANLDGREGVAYGVVSDGRRRDVIIDAATGRFIGGREILLEGFGGVPRGTISSYTSVTTAVVDRMGERPAG